ncbi:hypothetical protein [Meiothermus granaticius]|uniref:DsrE/DsrF-like family protein n=1 Tax=Meiothermus granaticius NBRC 107808 TaxID=1227551 RepID=A0A399F4R0_9DEIN|nr:hypothetical protein [Meiothermus granaticius]RIH91063.1 hypothetical protein Mgrana_03035 [Meiothermus granaticius NBRC 107808]GEM87944.1 hypothetical protein MGR01S_25690 [Meiothermus granaticius NBRC 107808]
MKRVVIHIFHADESSLGAGSHVAERIRQVMQERNVGLEVYIFGPAEKALLSPDLQDYNTTIDGLVQAGVPVLTCLNTAKALGAEETFSQRGLRLAYARDKFVEYALEGATVISF